MTPSARWPAGAVCVVTGGTRGLGLATVEALAQAGASVALCGRADVTAAAVADAMAARHGVRTMGAGVDVSDPTAVEQFAAMVSDQLGTPDLVVSNAATLGPVGPLIDVDLEAWQHAISVDLVGVANTTASFGRRMAERGSGTIVNVSGGGIGGPGIAPRISAYTASKAAVAVLTETTAVELAGFGIRVNAIAPGPQPTGFTDEILRSGADVAGAELYGATARNQAAEADPSAYLRLLFFVASPDASWLTGRLLSARWDSPESLTARRSMLTRPSLMQLRRIDDDLYSEGPPSGG